MSSCSYFHWGRFGAAPPSHLVTGLGLVAELQSALSLSFFSVTNWLKARNKFCLQETLACGRFSCTVNWFCRASGSTVGSCVGTSDPALSSNHLGSGYLQDVLVSVIVVGHKTEEGNQRASNHVYHSNLTDAMVDPRSQPFHDIRSAMHG